jgi:hypothetical protein
MKPRRVTTCAHVQISFVTKTLAFYSRPVVLRVFIGKVTTLKRQKCPYKFPNLTIKEEQNSNLLNQTKITTFYSPRQSLSLSLSRSLSLSARVFALSLCS